MTQHPVERPLWKRVALGALRLAGTVLFVAVAAYLVGRWRAPDLPDQAPPLALRDLDGQVVRLPDLRGRTVVVNFWAPWCLPCKIEIPAFSRFARAHPDIVVLGVAEGGAPDDLRAAARDLGIDYPVLIGDPTTLAAWGVKTFPTTVVVDGSGRVVTAHTGLMLDPQLAWATGVW